MGKHRRGMIIGAVVVAVLIGIGLAVFFCYPRNPTVSFGTPSYSGLTSTSTYFSVVVQMPFTVENPNYYDLNLQSLNLEIDYESVYIGNLVQNSTVDFYKQATTEHILATTLTTSDSSIASEIQQSIEAGTPLQVSFSGPAEFKALFVTVTRHISMTKDLTLS